MKLGAILAAALLSGLLAVSTAQAACPTIPSGCGECVPAGQPEGNPYGCIQVDKDNYFAGSAETLSGCVCVGGTPRIVKNGMTAQPLTGAAATNAACSKTMADNCK